MARAFRYCLAMLGPDGSHVTVTRIQAPRTGVRPAPGNAPGTAA